MRHLGENGILRKHKNDLPKSATSTNNDRGDSKKRMGLKNEVEATPHIVGEIAQEDGKFLSWSFRNWTEQSRSRSW